PGGADHKYVHFVLVKENRDTMDVIENLARVLNCKPSVFSYAGVKDRRAVTVQRLCAYKLLPDRLAGIEQRGTLGAGVRLGDMRFASKQIKTGELAGNRFTVVLRAVPAAELALVDAAARSIGAAGFVNFYGLQRFGNNPAAPTHHIGRALLRRQWREAIDLILAPRGGENAQVHVARTAYAKSRDPAECLRLMPPFMGRERALLDGLVAGGDLLGTIARIHRGLRMLYLHAYQSYVWNCVASERIRCFGSQPIVGDLPAEGADAPPADKGEAADEAGEGAGGELHLPKLALRALTQADVDARTFAITDVLLPLPGTDVLYPANEVGALYAEVMAVDGLDPHDMDRKVREHSLAGGYRKLVVCPGEMSHALLSYTHPDQQLTVTDMDLLRERPPSATAAPAAAAAADSEAAAAPAAADPAAGGPLHAVSLDFTLPAGCYATMLLRELCKRST
ncbi:pseudouridine synthase, partial [Pavlovales sp. CCMP2436]